jgi:hypothetical protein
LHFEEVYSLPIPLREPVRQTLTVQRSALPPCSAWTVSAYRDQDNWAKITLVPTVLVASAWARVEAFTGYLVELVAFKTANGDWQARLMKSADFATLASQIPSSFMDTTGTLPPLAGGYRLPWRDGETWWAITPWHDGNALDFQPTIGASHSVLAAESGFMTELCSDGTQSLLQIRHADGRATYYLHLRLALDVRRTLLDHPVQRGQYLGELINRTAFVTPCGRGYSRHLHFITSDRTLVVDGFPLEQIAETAACCNNPPRYTSSNLRVDAQAP